MTVATELARARYSTNATTGPFTVPFYFLAADHVEVYYTDSAGTETLLTETTHYSLTGAGNAAGGTVTTVTAYASGGYITIIRSVPATQLTDYQSGDAFAAESHETALDKLTMVVQQQNEKLDRALVFGVSDTGSGQLPTVTDRANRLLAFDSLGQPTSSAAPTGTAAAVLVDLANSISTTMGDALVAVKRTDTGAVATTQHVVNNQRAFSPVADAGATGDGVADDTSALAVALAASLYIDLGGPSRSYKISGPLTLRTGHVIKGHGATITQTLAQAAPGDAVEIFNVTSKTDIDISGVYFVGVGTDTIESDSSRACAVYGATAQARVHVHDCRFTGFAYTPARFIGATSCSFTHNIVVGPGSPELTAITSGKNYGVLFDTGCVDCLIAENSFSKCAQGVRVEASDDIRVHKNYIFDITGQHGVYAGSDLRNISITDNIIWDVDLCGIKVQATDATDSFGITVQDNIVHSTGDQGILLTNGTGGAGRNKVFNVSNNIVRAAGASALNIQHSNGGVVAGNTLNTPVTYGINLKTCDDVLVSGNHISSSVLSGMLDEAASTRITVKGNQFTNVASAATVSDRYGMLVNTCTGWTIDDNTFHDANAKMDYGIFIVGGDQTTLSVRNNSVFASVLAGFRAKTGPEGIRAYFGNYWGGTLPTATDPVSTTVASATALTLPQGKDVVIISGTTNITSVLVAGHTDRIVTLIFQGILTFTDGSNLTLAGNFVTTANDTITIACDGSNWFEVCRSVN